MSSKELAEFVKQDQAVYDGKLKAWEADRCEGKRAKRTSTADAGTKVVGEQSSGVEPRQILGYHWPLQLLQEHEIEFDKKQVVSIQHLGKSVRGVARSEWVFGAIEVTQTCSKKAKKFREQAFSDSDNDIAGSL